MPLTMSLSQWPIVVITHVGDVTDAEVDAHLLESGRIFAKQEPYASVFDSTKAGKVSPYMRKRVQEWMNSNAEAMEIYSAGNAFVFASPAMRFLLSTMLLFRDHKVPHHVCGKLDEGMKWAREQVIRRKSSAM